MTPTTITAKQHEYLLELRDGTQTTGDIATSLCVSRNAASRMMMILRDAGLVRSTRKLGVLGNIWNHSIIGGYDAIADELDIILRKSEGHGKPHTVSDAELQYVAKLRDAGMTGLELIEKYQERYPDQPATTIKNRIQKARVMGLCR